MKALKACYELNVCSSPPKFICWSANPQCNGFRKWLGHEGGGFMNGISALRRRDMREMISFSQPCEDTMRRQVSISQEADPHQTLNLLVPWSWTSPPPELGEINVCGLSLSLYGIFVIAALIDIDRLIVYFHQLSSYFLFVIEWHVQKWTTL